MFRSFKYPSYYLTIIIITLILLVTYFIDYQSTIYLSIGVSCLIIYIILYFIKKKSFQDVLLIISIVLILLAYLQYRINQDNYPRSFVSENIIGFSGQIITYPTINYVKYRYMNCKRILRKRPFKRQEYRLELKYIQLSDGTIKPQKGIVLIKSRHIISDLKLGHLISIESSLHLRESIRQCEEFDYKRYLKVLNIKYLSYPQNKSLIKYNSSDHSHIIQKLATKIHYSLIEIYKKNLSYDNSILLTALILGKRDEISEDTYKIFTKAGVIHILALSGLHTATIALVIFILLSIFRIPLIYNLILSSIILLLYLFIAEFRPPIVRAVIMYICMAIIFILDRDREYLNSLFIACSIILLYNPLNLFSISFQLSFLATFGIILYIKPLMNYLLQFTPYNYFMTRQWIFPINKTLAWIIKLFTGLLSLTITAQIFIIPILIYNFNGISIISIISNLIIVPITQISVSIGIILPILSFSDYLLSIFSTTLQGLLYLLIKISENLANLSYSYIDNLFINNFLIFIYYFLWIILPHSKKIYRWIKN